MSAGFHANTLTLLLKNLTSASSYKGCFAGITVDQLDLFVLFGLDVLARSLELWDLQVIGWGLLGIERGLGHANREVVSLCYFEAVILAGISCVYVAPKS